MRGACVCVFAPLLLWILFLLLSWCFVSLRSYVRWRGPCTRLHWLGVCLCVIYKQNELFLLPPYSLYFLLSPLSAGKNKNYYIYSKQNAQSTPLSRKLPSFHLISSALRQSHLLSSFGVPCYFSLSVHCVCTCTCLHCSSLALPPSPLSASVTTATFLSSIW